jgi:hypothetical protein
MYNVQTSEYLQSMSSPNFTCLAPIFDQLLQTSQKLNTHYMQQSFYYYTFNKNIILTKSEAGNLLTLESYLSIKITSVGAKKNIDTYTATSSYTPHTTTQYT